MNLLAGGGQEVNEELIEEVVAKITPTASPSAIGLLDQVKELTFWEKFQPYLLWLVIIVLLIIVYIVIRKLINKKK